MEGHRGEIWNHGQRMVCQDLVKNLRGGNAKNKYACKGINSRIVSVEGLAVSTRLASGMILG